MPLRVAMAAQGDGMRLVSHAYVRYFGDLSGGQVLKRLLGQSMALPPEALTLYDFPGISDPQAFKDEMRNAIDRAAHAVADPEDIDRGGADRLRAQYRCVARGAVTTPVTLRLKHEAAAGVRDLLRVLVRPARMPDQVIQHFGGPVDRGAHAFEHLQHAGIVDAIGDLERGELRILHHGCQKLLVEQVGLGIDARHFAAVTCRR